MRLEAFRCADMMAVYRNKNLLSIGGIGRCLERDHEREWMIDVGRHVVDARVAQVANAREHEQERRPDS